MSDIVKWLKLTM